MFGVYAGEFGTLALGTIVYILLRRRLKQIAAVILSFVVFEAAAECCVHCAVVARPPGSPMLAQQN